MTARRAKHGLVYAGLLAFTVWPLVHVVLVERYDVSPWKLGGWGMYSAPRLDFAGIRVFADRGDGGGMRYMPALPPELHPQAARFLESYRWLRRLVRPDPLARSILERYPEIRRLRIVVYQPVVDRDSAMIEMKEVAYEYPA